MTFDSTIAEEALRIVATQTPRRLGPKQLAWIEKHIPNVRYCAAAVAARDESAAPAAKLAEGGVSAENSMERSEGGAG